jgi:hypothetical protein
MRRYDNIMKLRTTAELGVMLKVICALVTIGAVASLFFVKSIGGALIILVLPIVFSLVSYLISIKYKNALMINVLDFDGVRNESGADVLCDLEWNEIGDFGIAEVEKGFFRGRYVYMSRIFIGEDIREDIVNRYDPRICIVFPYTEETAYALREASGEKIDLI